MLGPALSWPRVPEDRVTPGRSLAALTAPIPPAVLEAKVTPRGGGGALHPQTGHLLWGHRPGSGQGQPPGPHPGQSDPLQGPAVWTEMHTLQGAGPAEHLGR